MTPIRRSGSGTPHIHSDLPPVKQHAVEQKHGPVDQIERHAKRHLDPTEMRRHIDKVLEGPWGPIDARALYSAPVPDQPEIPRDALPGWPGGMVSLYAVDIDPGAVRPRPPEIQPMYGVHVEPDRPPIDFQPLYSIGDDPHWLREPLIRAMYGIDLGDQHYWPRKA